MTSHNTALIIAQQAIALLLKWANAPLPTGCDWPDDNNATTRAKQLLGWTDTLEQAEPPQIGVLQLLFDRVKLPQQDTQNTDASAQSDKPSQPIWHYVPLGAIANATPTIPYPLDQEPTPDAIAHYQQQMQTEVLEVFADAANWQNLSLLMLILEKYGSCLSFGEADVALIDRVRMVGAIASSLAPDPDAEQLSLVAADLSGIQAFIYTISSDGALKSLRARSFYLELLTEEVVQQVLDCLDLPRTNIIYAGGGNLFVLAPVPETCEKITEKSGDLEQLRQRLNRWLLKEFQGKLSLSLNQKSFNTNDVASPTFKDHWEAVIKLLAKQKQQKFRHNLSSVLNPRTSVEQCRVCHRDDESPDKLKPLKDEDSSLACSTCRMLFDLGDCLFEVKSIVRSHSHDKTSQDNLYRVEFKLDDQSAPIYYHLFQGQKPIIKEADIAFLINNWDIKTYQFRYFQGNAVPLLLGKYFQPVEEFDPETQKPNPRFIRAEELAERSVGIKRVGYLRMDVDRLGQIFANGLGQYYSLPRLAGLSRQMSYFFKVYLNSLADNHPSNASHSLVQLPGTSNANSINASPENNRPNLLFIYAGGDDLFVSGSWNEIVDFAIDIYQSFRQYAGGNPDITLSGGISLAGPKFPLYQAAAESGEAEHAAKANGRDSLGLFDQAFKWSEWLGCHPSVTG